MRILLFLLLAPLALCQTSPWPTSIAGDQFFKVTVNGIQTTLVSAIGSTAPSASVTNCTGIVPNTLATMDQEITAVQSCSGGIITFDTTAPGCTSGRGCDNTTPAAHNGGIPVSLFLDAWPLNALRVSVEAIETQLGAGLNTTLNTITLTPVTGSIISPIFNADVAGYTGNTFQNSDGSFMVTYQGYVEGQEGIFTNTAVAPGHAVIATCGQVSPLLNCGSAISAINNQPRSSSTIGFAYLGLTTGNNGIQVSDNLGICTTGTGVGGTQCTIAGTPVGPSVSPLKNQNFSALPSCAANYFGSTAAVADSTTNTFGATITGSGADPVLAFCNGTNWTVIGR